jgi:hypothetical protein
MKAARSPLFEAGGKRAVALRLALKARHAAHPQERSLIAGAGSMLFLQTRRMISRSTALGAPRPR